MSIAVKPKVKGKRSGVAVLAVQPYRFTVAQYNRMIAEAILTPNDHVELLEGWIVEKMPRNPPHDGTVNIVLRRLMPVLPDEWRLRVQSAVTLSDSQPEPDLAVVRGPEQIYLARHPTPRDIGLLIEVADSTILLDRLEKGAIYAKNHISAYWIVNIGAAKVEVYTQARGGKSPGYRQKEEYEKHQSVPLILGDVEITKIPVKLFLP